ncbi:amino acid adenylation domain-containing protein [Streptomyces cynarae]|uniref:Amino acid adenylation domain-containing protein n=1 Tax=Streptomyces cynarae TaxID=2981134 RepID=A0ABY6EB86_9ACTN|nr:amino acid adenylation domain-containing protein [Streptomyces cynarae]UXY23934.1 amino acid adenylation domain-containing protein [Streptomyces cynarae]
MTLVPNAPVLEPGDEEFWRSVLTRGGFTTVPRWTLTPVPGVAQHEVQIPPDVMAAARRLADDMAVPLNSVLLAAHAKVLAALSGERDVTTGYIAEPDTGPLPCRLTTHHPHWRALVREARRAETGLLAHKQAAVEDLERELQLPGRLSEASFAAFPADREAAAATAVAFRELPAGTVWQVMSTWSDSGHTLRLRYRRDAVDAPCAARIVGYHLTALALMAADPAARPGQQSLLSAEEVRLQLEGLAGPRRRLPQSCVHALIEQRVRDHPNRVSIVHGDRQWTYAELNQRANYVARALLGLGAGREDVVAVVTERNVDWAAAVLGVLKAGCVYLPVEPRFPADRIAAMLSRAGCRLVLTEPGSTTNLSRAVDALPGARTLLVEAAYGATDAAGDLDLDVRLDQLAYIFFTSGSTGEPKGAMCEHAGMLNHIHAKIDDLRIGEGQVVAQTAPQCFDISLWQLLAALVAGGRTLLVPQEVIEDVPRYLDTIAEGRVSVLQAVPSYLDAVVSSLERCPRELPDLRCVSVTGEALKKDLVERWFRAQPGIRLVNAYGLTETSDDTNHEVMDQAPDTDRIPLGRPVNNVRVRVVDDNLSPVPLGAPGEIVFAGVCVGRGYVNDPERTRQSFTTDPYRTGDRLYRSGDYGRWLPDGKLDFLGRRDSQVKVRGFRVEIEEVENALLKVPGVRAGAVTVTQNDRGGRLVAFCCGEHPPADDTVRQHLSRHLPAYMVPSSFHWRDHLPLTGNGKVDRKALASLAGELDHTGPHDTCVAAASDTGEPPRTPTEERLAAAWATVLGIPQHRIGRQAHFFDDGGGTSLTALQLAIRLDRTVSLKDLTHHPVLADLARLLDVRAASSRAASSPTVS